MSIKNVFPNSSDLRRYYVIAAIASLLSAFMMSLSYYLGSDQHIDSFFVRRLLQVSSSRSEFTATTNLITPLHF